MHKLSRFFSLLLLVIVLGTGISVTSLVAQAVDEQEIVAAVQAAVSEKFGITVNDVTVDNRTLVDQWAFGTFAIPSAGLPETYHYIGLNMDTGWQVTVQNDADVFAELANSAPDRLIDAETRAQLFPSTEVVMPDDGLVENYETGSLSPYYPIQDIFVAQGTTNGNRRNLAWGYDYAVGWGQTRSLIRFDPISLPAGAYATSVRLQLWQYNCAAGGGQGFYVARVTSDWNNSTAWGGPSYEGDYGSSTHQCNNSIYAAVQVPDVVINPDLVNNYLRYSNYGILLRNYNEGAAGTIYCAGDNLDTLCTTATRPRLLIDYRINDPGTPTITAPTQNQVITSLPLTLTVTPGTTNGRGSVVYEKRITTTANCAAGSNIIWSSSSASATEQVSDPDLVNGTFYACVRQGDSLGLWSAWTADRAFSINLHADVAVSQTAVPSPVVAGTNLTYTITVSNAGPSTATGVNFVDTIPTNAAFVSATPSQGSCTLPPTTTLNCALGNINNAANATITLVVNVNAGAVGTVSNTATANPTNTDPSTGNNTATTSTPIEDRVDVAITKLCSPDPVVSGANLTCQLTVTNNGPLDATGVSVTDTLPGGMTFVSATTSHGICSHNTGLVACALGSLAKNETTTIDLVGTITASGGTITNSATISATQPDLNSANNTASDEITVTPLADLSITKTTASQNVSEGAPITYTLTVNNAGPSNAASVVVTDTLPSGMTFVSASPSQGTCSHSAGVVTCNLNTLNTGAGASITLVASVNVGATGTQANTATIASSAADPNTANNTASANINVVTSTVTIGSITLQPGQSGVVPVDINCIVDSCNGFQMNLAFDKNIIRVDNVRFGSFLGPSVFATTPVIDNNAGTVLNYAVVSLNSFGIYTGTGRLFEVDVTALTPGTSSITPSNVIVTDPAANVVTVIAAPGQVTVNANTAPTISAIADQATYTGEATSAIDFTVGDAETAVGSLSVSGSSNNTTLVPNANIALGGSAASRTVTLTPAAGQTGTAQITLTVTDGGSLTATTTFTLTVSNRPNTPPTISAIADQATYTGEATSAIDFTVGDAETAVGSLTVSGSSSNATLVPNANIALGGSGASRTVTITPAAGQIGTAQITLTVTDGGGLTAATTFTLTVGSRPNTPPTISSIGAQTTCVDDPTPALSFTVGDAETAVGSLTLSGSSSNTNLVPNGNIVFGGSGASRTVTVTPAAGQSGTTTITLMVTDGGSLSAQTTFGVTVNASCGEVVLALVQPTITVGVGEQFDVVVQVRAGSTPVEGAEAYLNFDPAKLQMVSITPGGVLTTELLNASSNQDGTIDYAAAQLSGTVPTGTFTLITVRFQALVKTETTYVTFNTTFPRATEAVTANAVSVLNHVENATVTITGTVIVAINPASLTSAVGTNFSFDVVVQAGSQAVEGVQIALNFDATKMQLVSITPGTSLPDVLSSTYDNAFGTLDYAAGKLSGALPSDTFTLVTIQMQAVAAVDASPITFSLTLPRQTDVVYNQESVFRSAENATVTIINSTVNAAVSLQGRSTAPNARWSIPLSVRITPNGTSTPVVNTTYTTDQYGHFTVLGLTPGTYQMRVKNVQTLSCTGTLTVVAGTNNYSVGILRTGDVDGNDIVNILDFSQLKASFGKVSGAVGFNPNADLDGNLIVNILDFSLLKGSFGKFGGTCAQPASLVALDGQAAASILSLVPMSSGMGVGDEFDVQIMVNSAGAAVDSSAAFVNYDPAALQIVSVTPGTSLTSILLSEYDNTLGTLDFAAGELSDTLPTGSFVLATVRFRAAQATSQTSLTFALESPRQSDVVSGSQSVLSAVENTSVTINAVQPPVATTLIEPYAAIVETAPLMRWTKVPSAEWYYLWVSGDSGHVLDQWFDGSQICADSECALTLPVTLATGNYRWWVQAWGSRGGYGEWSAGLDFAVAQPPTAPVLVAPFGRVETAPLTFNWNTSAGATWYYLWVTGPQGHVLDQWYDAYGVCDALTCSVTPPVGYVDGEYQWWVQAWSPVGGYSAWTQPGNFAFPSSAPTTTPLGTITTGTPTFTWTAVNSASWYYIWVSGPDGHVLDQWFDAAGACMDGICSATPALALNPGSYRWWVVGWNSTAGLGAWSVETPFTVAAPFFEEAPLPEIGVSADLPVEQPDASVDQPPDTAP